MQLDSYVALLGTGVAPLIAASQLLSQGKSILLLNPDLDFFLEDSELSLDPLLQGKLSVDRLIQNSREHALDVLRPDFPGPLEFWGAHSRNTGFHDPDAPHLRERERIWMASNMLGAEQSSERLENLFVEAEDAGLNPKILEGSAALRRFPGVGLAQEQGWGLVIPGLCDIDLTRYRTGLLEFLRERLGDGRLITGVSEVELVADGIRFRVDRQVHTATLEVGLRVFWTPRLTNWVMNQARSRNVRLPEPKGVRLWEEWSLVSRDLPDLTSIGTYTDMVVWADFEGPPQATQAKGPYRLKILRAGPLTPIRGSLAEGPAWISEESLASLYYLNQNILRWDSLKIRDCRTHAIFEWDSVSHAGKRADIWQLGHTEPPIHIIQGCDGPLIDVVRVAKKSCSVS